MARLEGWSPEVALARCTEVDRTRRQFARYFFGEAAIQSAQYDLVVNTGRVPLEMLTETVVEVVNGAGVADSRPAATSHKRVLIVQRNGLS